MKNGFKIFDSDTHVFPSSETLERYVEPSFRPRLQELDPHNMPVGKAVGIEPDRHLYRVNSVKYRRILGEAGPHESFTGEREDTKWMGSKIPRAGVQDDDAVNRILDMDDEGADAHFVIPTSWVSASGLNDPDIEVGLSRSYHRFMDDFCGYAPDRLKGLIAVSSRNIEESVDEIKRWGQSKWAVAVLPIVDNEHPVDHPDLEPIWKAAAEHDLAIMHHSFTWTPPYFPGYQDLWDNVFLGRLASHPWGGMRFMAAVIGGGIMDRYPDLRVGILECGFGWLPFWAKRMDEQASYVGSTAKLMHKCSEYVNGGRFFCSIEMHEGEEMFNLVTNYLGDGLLMYASDYPHSECHFPESVDHVMDWTSLSEETRQKLFWDNANRFYKRT